MSGYGSKSEVTSVVKQTIIADTNDTGMSRDPADYNIAGIVRENFRACSGYGWRATTDADGFAASLARNLRSRK